MLSAFFCVYRARNDQDGPMAFVKQSGGKYQVRQGNNNDLLKTFSSRQKADDYVQELHRKNDPKSSNRGKNAAKKFR